MRLESLIIGVVILAFGIFLVATGGSIGGVSLPGLIGLPSSCSGGSTNQTNPACFGPAAYGIGSIVCLFGLGMIGNGLRAPSGGKGFGGGGTASMPPEIAATLAAARQHMERIGPTQDAGAPAPPGSRFCPECGRPNAADAGYCQRCGKPMPPPSPAKPST
jgi:zinc-ribbon domain